MLSRDFRAGKKMGVYSNHVPVGDTYLQNSVTDKTTAVAVIPHLMRLVW